MVFVSPDRQKTAAANAEMVVSAIAPQLEQLPSKADLANAVEVAARKVVEHGKAAAEHERKAIECETLGEKYVSVMSARPDDEAADWAQFESFRRPGEDDLAVIDRISCADCEGNEAMAHQRTKWIPRFRTLLAEGYDSGVAPVLAHRLPTVSPPSAAVERAVVSPPVASTASDDPKPKRRRLADCPGLPQKTLTECGTIQALWTEYVGTDGQGGLRRRDAENPKWHGQGPANKPSRDLYRDKMFFYREIARQVRDRNSVPDALAAVQARLDGLKKRGRGGWGLLLKELEKEQPNGAVRDELNRLL